jgi:pheromone shutdown protein TraB
MGYIYEVVQRLRYGMTRAHTRCISRLCLLLSLAQDLTLYMSMYWGPILLSSILSNLQMNCLRSDPLSILIGMIVMVLISANLNQCASQATSKGIGPVRLSIMGY